MEKKPSIYPKSWRNKSSIHPPWWRKKSSIYLTWWTTTDLSIQCEGEKFIHLSYVMEKNTNPMWWRKILIPIYQSIFSKRECRKSHPFSQHEGENFIHLSTCVRGGRKQHSQQHPYLGRRRKTRSIQNKRMGIEGWRSISSRKELFSRS
jgi:hypothetical protein